MRSLKPRERAMLWGLILALMVGAFYVLVYGPRSQTNATLATQLAAARADLSNLQAQAQRKDALEQQVKQMQTEIQTFEAKLPTSKEVPGLLVQLDALAHQSGVQLTLIKPSALKPAAAAQSGAATPQNGAAAPPAGSGPKAPRVGQASPSPLADYQEFTVEVQVQGTFPTVLAFAHGLETFPRFLAISDIKLTPAPAKGQPAVSAQPVLALDVTSTAYVVPATGGAR